MHITATEIQEQQESDLQEQQELMENNARMFAAITSEAHALAPLLEQEFEIRIKSNDEAAKALSHVYFGAVYDQEEKGTHLLGKIITVKVDWSAIEHAKDYMFIEMTDGQSILLNEHNIKCICTQKGQVFQMFELWKLAVGK